MTGMHRNGLSPRRPIAAEVHTTAPARREPLMQPLTAVVLAAPLIGPLTAAAYRHARRTLRRRSQ